MSVVLSADRQASMSRAKASLIGVAGRAVDVLVDGDE